VAVEFRLLTGVEAWAGGARLDIGPARQRCVLAALLVDANRVVSADQLVDRVWGEHAPQTARATLFSYLARLRRVLAADGGAVIERRSGGYVLAVEPSAVDLLRFRQLVVQARETDPARALELYGRAFALWRGEAFGGLDSPWVRAVREGVRAERFAAERAHVDLRIQGGEHDAVIAELGGATADHPFDERIAAQLMLALYRGGRQADALAHYDVFRRRLVDELGTEPGPALRELLQRILSADPEVAAPTRAGEPPVPRQLPAAPRAFAGRHDELAGLTAALDGDGRAGTVVISAIAGMGGIGKTWLALRWAHDNADRFPDGVLFADLAGFSPAAAPAPPDVVLRGFLEALGVEQVPVDLEAKAALFRSLVAGRRLLVVLDNARDTSQVVPLLPGSATCTVLVTSRDRLAGLITSHGARSVVLDVLPGPAARSLLAHRVGARRLAEEPDAVAGLLSACAGLPLALGVVATRATLHPEFPLSLWAAELTDTATRLDTLGGDDPATSLTTVLSWSHAGLEPEQAELFSALGRAPGPDTSLAAAASLAGRSLPETGALLRALEQRSLIQQHKPGRWRMHDLVRLYAARREPADLPRALRRVVDFYLHTAFAAARFLESFRPPFELAPPAPGCQPLEHADYAAALAWLDAEHSGLLAAQQVAVEHGWDHHVWRLAWSLNVYHHRRARIQDRLATWLLGLAATERLGDPDVQAEARLRLGNSYANAGQFDAAQDQIGRALAFHQARGDPAGLADAHRQLAWISYERGDLPRAREHAGQAFDLYGITGNVAGQGLALNALGNIEMTLGDYAQAREHYERSLALIRAHKPEEEGAALDCLGELAQLTGQHAQALDYYRQALTVARAAGDSYAEPMLLDRIGRAHAALGQHARARAAWQQAVELCQAQHRTGDAERIRQRLG
jgi:DNA-binding SARP family transcriptional activator/tetratricopeptide (TPR) repeat protein